MDREELILNNMPLVYHVIHKYYPKYARDEDVEQCGMIGLIQAVDGYDETKSKFSTYAVTIIRREINRELKRREADKMLVSLDDLIERGGDVW